MRIVEVLGLRIEYRTVLARGVPLTPAVAVSPEGLLPHRGVEKNGVKGFITNVGHLQHSNDKGTVEVT
jgi:hypothetical protein